MRKILALFIFIAITLGGIILGTPLFLDKAIKDGVEKFGPKLTGSPITLGKVSLNILTGSGEITGITIGNPKGFKSDHAISLKKIRFAVEPKSLLSDKIQIREILVDSPAIAYETSLKGTNINRIMTNIQAATNTKNKKSDPESEKKEGKKFIIDDFLITNGQIRMSATILNDEALILVLPEVHLQDLGKESGGASEGDISRQIFEELNKGVGLAVSKSGKGTLDNAAGGVKSFIKGLGNAITGGN